MITEITGTSYENGKRISHQRVIYSKSDDLLTLTQLYRQLEANQAQLDKTVDAGIRKNLLTEKTKIGGQIAAQEAVIAGYTSAEKTQEAGA